MFLQTCNTFARILFKPFSINTDLLPHWYSLGSRWRFPEWNFVYFISFILRLEWQDEVGMTKSIIPGSFRTEWWSNETNNLIPHLCHPRPFWHGMIFEWQISSFRSHSGMTWDECLFAQNISRLLGRAMEGKRNDAEWLRNDRMTQEWWKDKRTTQMTKGW